MVLNEDEDNVIGRTQKKCEHNLHKIVRGPKIL